MTEILPFVLASLALSATPGPANALLFTSGALAGLRRSLALLMASALGYAIAITLLVVVLGPAVASNPGLKLALQVICVVNLVLAARSLWKRSALDGGIITMRRMFGLTVLNPKAFIFAFTILPYDPLGGSADLLPWLGLLLLLIGGAELAWIGAGRAVHKGILGPISVPLCCRAGATVIAGFAAVLTWSVVASGLALAGLPY
jgi:threonine/homoserine/homoserine lactone efflux protein